MPQITLHDVPEHFQLDQTALGGISTGAYICLTYNRLYGFDRVSKYLNIEHTLQSRIADDWQHGLFSEKQDELFACFERLLEMRNLPGRKLPAGHYRRKCGTTLVPV